MKRILTLWLAAMLVTVQPCYAVVMVGFGQEVTPATCGTFSFVGAPGEMETFENTEGDFCTIEFTEADASGYITTYSATAYHGGAHSAQFANTEAGTRSHYISVDLGATDTGFTLTFWWKTPNNGTVYSNAAFFALSNSATSTNMGAHNGTILWDGQGTNGKVAWNTESDTGQVLSTNTLSYNTWYKFVIAFTDGASSTLSIYNAADSLVETLTKTMKTQAPQYMYWFDSTGVGENTYLDDVQYDSTNP